MSPFMEYWSILIVYKPVPIITNWDIADSPLVYSLLVRVPITVPIQSQPVIPEKTNFQEALASQ
jgi:hypothetical protein